ncbi:MAG: sugar transferase [Clostridia bacterium]|nr:sugar transferase [Clostridia bacterium]
MNNQDLSIPFNLEVLKDEELPELLRELKTIVKNIVLRGIDIVGSLLGMMITLPLSMVVLINNLKTKDYGPLFYVHERIGKNGKTFKMYKFRTMVVNADEKLNEILEQDKALKEEYKKYKKLKNDPRVTKFGEFLRKTSLDEFPQFINVLKGEMSLVGPRPYMPKEIEDMGTYYKYIIKHKPGITGLWQISGRSELSFTDRLDLDMKYHYRKTVKNDIKILLITALITLKRKGAV